MHAMKRLAPALLVAATLGAPAIAAGAQGGADQAALPQQIEKLNAGQDALRQEILAMQKQLQEIRALLQARPAPVTPAQAAAGLPPELVVQGAPTKGSPKLNGAVPFATFKAPIDALLANAPPAE